MLSLLKALSAVFIIAFVPYVYAETNYPLTVEDGMGNELIIQSEPALISSKTLFTDEVLLAMVNPSRLTSLTNFAGDANFSNVSDDLPTQVPLLDLNVEAVLGNSPDIVFVANWSDAGIVEQLKQAGVVVYLVNTPFTVEAIQQEILKIGRILNATENAEALVSTMNEELAGLSKNAQTLAAKNIVALDYNSWGSSSGVDTTWQAVLKHAGIENGSAAYEQGAFGQVAMSKELIVEIDPDVLFLPGWIYGDDEGAQNFYEQIKNDPALAGIKAVRNDQIYQVPEALRGTYSQYIVDTIAFVIENVIEDVE